MAMWMNQPKEVRMQVVKVLVCCMLLGNPIVSVAQSPSIIKLPFLMEEINRSTDSVYVMNFWATWCKPCVAELPGFIEVAAELKNRKVKFIFISLDFKREFNSRLIPFLQKQNLPGPVYLLDEPDYNSWIDKVDSSWQGAIPATLILARNPRKQYFLEGEISADSLKNKLIPILPKP